MTISVRQDFGNDIAQMVLDEIQFQRSRYYYFLGGVEPWSGIGEEGTTDVAPSTVSASDEESREIRSEMVFSKLISPNDASLAIPRIEWATGTVYDIWDHTVDMDGKSFYVITSENKVYKCLDNASEYGQDPNPSTVEPSIVSIHPVRTADGYLWKYMYTVSAYARTRFSSVQYMPVKRALSDSFYNNGAVDAASVLTEGSGYPDTQLTTITVTGTYTGSGATGTLTVDGSGTITGVTVTAGGTGYTKGVRVTVTSSTGAGAELEATIAAGVITAVTVVSGGIGYAGADTVVFYAGGGAELLPVISRDTGTIESVTILDAGVGYDGNPTLAVVGAGGTGKYGNPNAVIEAIEYNGSIVGIAIHDPGIDYPVDNATTISVQGDGTGASFSPVIYDGRVVDVIVEDSGSGYTDIILTVNSDTGTGATVRGVITQSDYTSDQATIEQTAVDGAIYTVVVSDGGANYTDATITITGNGTGATAHAEVVNGVVRRIVMDTYGGGYTWATVTITDPGRDNDIIPLADRAAAYAVLPPVGGHGKDAPLELRCNTVAINTPLRGDLVVQSIVQDFRTFGIIKNPTSILTGAFYTSESALLTYKMDFVSTTGLTKDTVLTLSNNRYRVIDLAGDVVHLAPLSKDNVVPIGTLTVEGDTTQYTTTQAISVFDMNKYSGKLLYVSTESPFEFSAEQSITIKTYITF